MPAAHMCTKCAPYIYIYLTQRPEGTTRTRGEIPKVVTLGSWRMSTDGRSENPFSDGKSGAKSIIYCARDYILLFSRRIVEMQLALEKYTCNFQN